MSVDRAPQLSRRSLFTTASAALAVPLLTLKPAQASLAPIPPSLLTAAQGSCVSHQNSCSLTGQSTVPIVTTYQGNMVALYNNTQASGILSAVSAQTIKSPGSWSYTPDLAASILAQGSISMPSSVLGITSLIAVNPSVVPAACAPGALSNAMSQFQTFGCAGWINYLNYYGGVGGAADPMEHGIKPGIKPSPGPGAGCPGYTQAQVNTLLTGAGLMISASIAAGVGSAAIAAALGITIGAVGGVAAGLFLVGLFVGGYAMGLTVQAMHGYQCP